MEFGKMELSEYGVFDSRVKFPRGAVTEQRRVDSYEIELFTEEQTGCCFVDGQEVASSADFVPVADEEDRFYVYFRCFTADQMRQQFQVVFYRDDKQVSNRLNYSMESYIYSTVNNGKASQSLKDLVIAAMKYGDSVRAYVK